MGLKILFTVAYFKNKLVIVQSFLAVSSMCAAGLASVPPWDPPRYVCWRDGSQLSASSLAFHILCTLRLGSNSASTLVFVFWSNICDMYLTLFFFYQTVRNSLLSTISVCAFASAKLQWAFSIASPDMNSYTFPKHNNSNFDFFLLKPHEVVLFIE